MRPSFDLTSIFPVFSTNMALKKILITGGSGFIGSALAQRLSEEGIDYSRVIRDDNVSGAVREGTDWRINWPRGLSQIDYSEYSSVVHLAKAAGSSFKEEVSAHLEPVKLLCTTLSNFECNLVFVSSQSASPNAVSGYGVGKWSAEQQLKQSAVSWTIVRPGLVVGKGAAAGLFGAIRRVVKLFPVVIVPDLRVQPVLIGDLVEELIAVINNPQNFCRKEIGLALFSRSLAEFVRDIGLELGVRRWAIAFPTRGFEIILSMIVKILPKFPLTPGQLQGLSKGQLIEPRYDLTPFGIPQADTREDRFLAWECRYLLRILFDAEPSERILRRYHEYHRLNPEFLRQSDTIELLRQGRDLEVVEFRRRSGDSYLSQKFQLLSYLSEIEPTRLDDFVAKRPSLIRGYLKLGLAVLRSASRVIVNWSSR